MRDYNKKSSCFYIRSFQLAIKRPVNGSNTPSPLGDTNVSNTPVGDTTFQTFPWEIQMFQTLPWEIQMFQTLPWEI